MAEFYATGPAHRRSDNSSGNYIAGCCIFEINKGSTIAE